MGSSSSVPGWPHHRPATIRQPGENDATIPHVAASLRRCRWQQSIVARRTAEANGGGPRPAQRLPPVQVGAPTTVRFDGAPNGFVAVFVGFALGTVE